jgi:hypothetical protein
MRAILILGALLLVFGLLSLFIPIPHREKHGFTAGPISVGVETTDREKVPPMVSGILIAGGVALIIVGARKRVM